jgi:branched-chain amino acid transport system substrate-binding protein
MGFRTVTVIGTDFIAGYEFIAGALDEFKAKGGQVVQEQWFPLGTKDFGPYLSAFKPADAVLAWVAGGDEIAFYQQYRDWKIEMPVMQAVMDTLADPQFMPLMGDTNVGVFGMIMGVWTVDTPENKAWAAAYEQEFGEAPSYWAYDGYITTSVALAALEATGGDTDPDKLASAITNVSVDTPFGNYAFSKDKVVIKNYYLVRDDKIGGEVVPVVLGTYRMQAVRVGDIMVPELVQ